MLEIKDLGIHFGDRSLFEGVNLQLFAGHRYGLVGANGSGKSTFLKVLSGEQTQYTGQLNWPSDCKLGMLKQDHFRYEEQSLVNTVLQGRPLLWESLQLQAELSQKAEFSEADTQRFTQAQTLIEKENGYAAEAEVSRLLSGLGLPDVQHHQPLKVLSGGYKLRVLMAQLLFSQPEILLLDEPTNHLDVYAIQWLGGYLKQYKGLLIVVSHDREFLNEVCTDTIDIDYGSARHYAGNYDSFMVAKAQEREQKEKELERQSKLREDTQQFIDRFRAKATKASAVQSRVKMLDKLESIDLQPSSRRYPHFAFSPQQRSGQVPLQVKEISKAFDGRTVLNKVSFEVQRGDRIALIGANGIGKSTLLKILVQELPADDGKVKWGHGVEKGYFPQDYRQILPDQQSLYGWLSSDAEGQPEARLRSLLGQMLFVGNQVQHKICTLSGGESTRLVFSRLMLQGGNLLLLDEPTNHLDMEAIETLAEALQNFAGSLICVSHNRYFVRQIANRILELTPEGLNDFKGSYEEYLEKQGTDHLERNQTRQSPAPNAQQAASKRQNQLDYEAQKQQQRQLRNLERKLPELEARCLALEEKVQAKEADLAEAYLSGSESQQQQLLQQQSQLQQELEAAFTLWEQTESDYQELLQASS